MSKRSHYKIIIYLPDVCDAACQTPNKYRMRGHMGPLAIRERLGGARRFSITSCPVLPGHSERARRFLSGEATGPGAAARTQPVSWLVFHAPGDRVRRPR